MLGKSQKHSVSPKEIWPIPKPKKKISNKGPKPSKAAIITSSPYKTALLEASEKRKHAEEKKNVNKDDTSTKQPAKKTKTSKKQTVKRTIKFKEDESDHSVDSGESVLEMPVGVEHPGGDEVPCMFGEGLFSADHRGELWVQCVMCEGWAHNECAGSEKNIYMYVIFVNN